MVDPIASDGRDLTVVVGLGNIGSAIGRALLAAGLTVVGVDIDRERVGDWLRRRGQFGFTSLPQVEWDRVRAVFVVVRYTSEVQTVLAGLAAESVVRDTPVFVNSTMDVAYARTLGDALPAPWRVIELPVSGGWQRAEAGDLTVMAAGPLTDDDVAFLEASMATRTFRFTEYGTPTIAKLVNNVTAAYNARIAADLVLLASQAGVDPTTMRDILLCSSGGSFMANRLVAMNVPSGTALLEKDIALLRDLVGELPEVSLPASDGLGGGLGGGSAEVAQLLGADNSTMVSRPSRTRPQP